MDSLIEHLNLWGERFLDFAWPMLWQSSLLIVVLFALDFVLRRKVRAGVRYALWLVVIVKLLLPPTLAVPTSIAWWVRPSPPANPPAKQYIVTYFNGERPQSLTRMYEQFAAGAFESPGANLSAAGWSIVASGIVSLGLLTWMILRWRHVARVVRCASPTTEDVTNLLNDAKRNLVLRRGVQLRLTNEPMSPAVCGLFRPVMLLPRSLVGQLPPRQLRAVMLHELVHLKRGDVWVNCAQALLQIVYWWHPLLWLANARIRRVREEAVDDAVMLALRDEAESYAPTLLEVAKLAFNRPLPAMGLVGIMESRSSLRQRIERLMDFHPPRKAGLTFASVFCVLAFGALAVPMEKSPSTSEKQASTQDETASPNTSQKTDTSTNLLTRTFKLNTNTFNKSLERAGSPPINRTNISAALRAFFQKVGVEFSPPKSVFYSDGTGMMMVSATKEDLDRIESAIQGFKSETPQINIKAKFVEVPTREVKKLLTTFFTNALVGGTNGFARVLTKPQADELMQAIKSTTRADILEAPEVTTLSGRQAQIQKVDLKKIVTGLTPVLTNGVTNLFPQTQTVPFGPVLDVLPHVSADGYMIEMTLTPSVTEFLGYDDPGTFQMIETPVSPKSSGQVAATTLAPDLPSKSRTPQELAVSRPILPLPRIRVRQITTTMPVWDGQTLVLYNFPDKAITKLPIGQELVRVLYPESKNQLLVFVTPTLVDQRGKRVHSDEEVALARKGVPPQKPVR